jgi:hypothetical protein
LLTVRSDAVIGGTSGGALLDGSSAWTDYVFSAKLDWNKGISFGLIGHYVDDKNYVVCNFTQPAVGSVHLSIHELVNGQDNDLADGQISNYNQLGGAGINTALSLQGTQAVCALNGYSISTVFASTKLTGPLSGEVGFTTWDRAPGGSEINVHSVGVTAQAYSLGNNNVQDPNK